MSDVDNPRRTVWTCKVSDSRTVRLEDIPARQLVDVCAELNVSWLVLVGLPVENTPEGIVRTLAMYEKCCSIAGVEPKNLTVRELLDAFELVDDDRPDLYVSGLPDPKADELTTAG